MVFGEIIVIEKIYKKYLENSFFELFILFLSIATLKITLDIPTQIGNVAYLLSILFLFLNKDIFILDKELKYNFIYLFVFLTIFSFLSTNIMLSLKGLIDISKAFLIFFITLFLIDKLKNKNYITTLLFLGTLILLGNFLSSHNSFYGYSNNPNEASIEIFIIFVSSLVFFVKNKLNYIIYSILIICSSILLFLGNSRGLFLGVFLSLIVIFYDTIGRFKKKFFYIYFSVLTILFVTYLFGIHGKPLYLNGRDKLWSDILNYTIQNNFFLGSGLNTVKLVIDRTHSITSTAHNTFIEIFVSSGIVGLCIFIYLLYLFIKYFRKLEYEKTYLFYVGLLGLITVIVNMQFDLKFASFPYLGFLFFNLGLIYSQRRLT